jgi:hypothetical protein
MTPAVATSVEVAVEEMDRDQAVAITQRIKEALERWQEAGKEVYGLLAEAQEGKAWRAMGYANFDEYVGNEFDRARTWGYDMLTRGFVTKAIGQAISEAGVDIDLTLSEVSNLRKAEGDKEELTLREATAVRGNLDEVTTEIRDRIQENPENAAEIVKEAVQKAAGPRKTRRREPAPMAETTVEVQGGEIIDAEIVEGSEELQAAVTRLMHVLDQLGADQFPDPEDMAPYMDTTQWEKVNRARIWLLRFNMVMP